MSPSILQLFSLIPSSKDPTPDKVILFRSKNSDCCSFAYDLDVWSIMWKTTRLKVTPLWGHQLWKQITVAG